MTQLEKLYQSIQNLMELGVQLPEKLIVDTIRVEEEIIKNDIIPALADTISPIISQIQREIVLVVEYVPDEPLSVKLTRKRSFTIPAEFDNKNNFKEREACSISYHSKSPSTGLRVTFPSGKIISQETGAQTLVDTIVAIGADRVKALNISRCGVKLVSYIQNGYYKQHPIHDRLFVMTHTSTMEKKKILDEISRRLQLDLQVEIRLMFSFSQIFHFLFVSCKVFLS